MSQTMRALACLVLAGLLTACNPPSGGSSRDTAPAGPVAGLINGEAIPESQLTAYAQARFQKTFADLTEEQVGQTREDFVRLFVLSQEAKGAGLENDPMVRMQNMNALAQALLRDKVENFVADEVELKARFEKMLNSGEVRELKARHILLESEEAAKAVITELDGGADFQELAKTKSTGPSGPQGGDLGWFGPGRMVPEFWEASLALEAGRYTSAPVKSQFGWHVILLEQTKDQPFAEAEPKLKAELQREFVESYVKNATGTATISWEGQN